MSALQNSFEVRDIQKLKLTAQEQQICALELALAKSKEQLVKAKGLATCINNLV